MKTTSAIVTALLAATTVTAQDPTRLHTRPVVPAREALERLNFKLGWRTYLPMDGRRDGFLTVQMPDFRQVLVQTRSGLVAALDAETGQVRWQNRLGAPYRAGVPLGYNSRFVFVINDQYLFALDRSTGQVHWSIDIHDGATAGPIADEQQLFVSLGIGRVAAFALPRPQPQTPAQPSGGADKKPDKPASPQGTFSYGVGRTPVAVGPVSGKSFGTIGRSPAAVGPLSTGRMAGFGRGGAGGFELHLDWNVRAHVRIDQTPLQSVDTVFIAGQGGKAVGLAKGIDPAERYSQRITDGLIAVPPGQYVNEKGDGTAYVAGQDGDVYAVDMAGGDVKWRFTGGTPIMHQPAVNDHDVFATPERGGLHRIDRRTGQVIWQNVIANRFLATNKKFVYATDRAGRLLVLDRDRGRQLGILDTRDFVVPIANELTDRVFLAANHGLLVCLHDREYATPLQLKRVPDLKRAAPAVTGGGAARPIDKGDGVEKP